MSDKKRAEEMAVVESGGGGLVQTQMTAQELLNRKRAIQEIQSLVMTEGIDYGVIPGCAKPTLLKPGAETLNVTFGLRPILDPATDIQEVDLTGGNKNFQVTVHILSASGQEIATGVGSCTTMESKYRYRKAEQVCPDCGKDTIIKGKKEYGGGWLCYQKKGGCGAKFPDGDPSIENQNMGRIEHDNPADYYNTCLKMAKKRALVDGTINATAASHIFTQDIEEMDRAIIQTESAAEQENIPAPVATPKRKQQPAAEPEKADSKRQGGKNEPDSGDDGWVDTYEEVKAPDASSSPCVDCGRAVQKGSPTEQYSLRWYGKVVCYNCGKKRQDDANKTRNAR